ncbi:MAG: hypothetical protein IT234_02180 [Bacteroidia bacterium]|nr:hypothetical protein [Bacteroidia bacterium]
MYKLIQLSKIDKDNKITGPMSPILAANELTKQFGTKYHCLIRLLFDDERVHNIYEHVSPCGKVKSELTGMDTLIYVRYYNNGDEAGMFIDMGTKLCPVALRFSDENIYTTTPIYDKSEYEIKLTLDEIKDILNNAIIFADTFKQELLTKLK